MKKMLVITMTILVVMGLTGCSKKEATEEKVEIVEVVEEDFYSAVEMRIKELEEEHKNYEIERNPGKGGTICVDDPDVDSGRLTITYHLSESGRCNEISYEYDDGGVVHVYL